MSRKSVNVQTGEVTVLADAPPTPAPVKPSNDEVYDQAIQNNRIIRALIKSINKGTLVTGGRVTGQELKAIIKAEM